MPGNTNTASVGELGKVRDAWAHTIAYYVVRGEPVPAPIVYRYFDADAAFQAVAAALTAELVA